MFTRAVLGLSIGVAAASLTLFTGCNAPTQFTVRTQQVTSELGLPGPTVPLPGLQVTGDMASNPNNSPGGVTAYNNVTNEVGNYIVDGAVVPAYWNHNVYTPLWCATVPIPPITYNGIVGGMESWSANNYWTANDTDIDWVCNVPAGVIPDSTSRFAIAGNIPASVTLQGQQPFSTAYGMPVLYMYSGADGVGSLSQTIIASSVAGDGSSATFPLPSSLASNGYWLVTANATNTGTGYFPNGVNYYSVASSQSQSGNPYGVAVAGISDEWADRDTCDRSNTGGTHYDSFPVIIAVRNEPSNDRRLSCECRL
jgi:hypothetical protein